MASAAVAKRWYLVRLLFMGLARNSSAGALIERHALSQSRYSYLNSFNVIARSVAGSRTPRCASSMIFGQRDVLRQTALRWGPNTSVASRTHWISLGDLRHRRRNDRGCAGVSSMRAFRPPCQRTGAPVRDSQWPGRRNLPRRGTPRRAPVCCGGLMTPKTMTSLHPGDVPCVRPGVSGEPEDRQGAGL